MSALPQIDEILAALSDDDRAALDVVMAQIEAAKRDGRLSAESSGVDP